MKVGELEEMERWETVIRMHCMRKEYTFKNEIKGVVPSRQDST